MTDRPLRPTYWEIVLEYLHEGYRAWQAHEDGASETPVQERLDLSDQESMDFSAELERLGLIALSEEHGSAEDFRLLPLGIAFMDASPTLENLTAAPFLVVGPAAPTRTKAAEARRSWKNILLEWAIKRGLDVTWENRRLLWGQLRLQFPWLPDFPDFNPPL
jgi:hypothetical protein